MKAVTTLTAQQYEDAVKAGPLNLENPHLMKGWVCDTYEEESGSFTDRWANDGLGEVLERKYCAHDNEHTFTLTCLLAGWPVTAETHEELECQCFACGTKFLRWFSKELIADPDDREAEQKLSLCSYCTDEEVVEDEEEESFPEVT